MALRFAILHHTGIPAPHFDLLFETHEGSDLASWRSDVWPISGRTKVQRLKDHRRAYLDFEGEISRRRGHVSRTAGGTCTVEVGEDAVWTISLLSGTSPATLQFHPAGDTWEVEAIR